MATRSGGIPGIAVGLAMTGAYLIFVGIKDVSFVDGLREFLKGTAPVGVAKPATQVPEELGLRSLTKPGSSVGGAIGSGLEGSGLGKKIAETGLKYQGVPYKWGGETPAGWDCSGFVHYVLTQVGVKQNRLTAAGYMTWGGATTIPRAQCAAGDLVCWTGHIGIAVNNTDMVNAPSFGIPTRVQKIWGAPAIRRVKG